MDARVHAPLPTLPLDRVRRPSRQSRLSAAGRNKFSRKRFLKARFLSIAFHPPFSFSILLFFLFFFRRLAHPALAGKVVSRSYFWRRKLGGYLHAAGNSDESFSQIRGGRLCVCSSLWRFEFQMRAVKIEVLSCLLDRKIASQYIVWKWKIYTCLSLGLVIEIIQSLNHKIISSNLACG